MTDKQLEKKNRELRDEMNAQGFGWIDGNYIKPPVEYQMMERKLDCISMINSILCYNCSGYTDAEKVMEYEENSYHNYLAEYVKLFGRANVVALIQEQINSIVGIRRNVATDSEGVSYNSIIWVDE